MNDLYKYAAQNRLRFESTRAHLTVEQLFLLDLKGAHDGCDLNSIAQHIHGQLKTMETVSFVEETDENPTKERLTVALDIVKDVIRTKQEAAKAATNRSKILAERAKILDLINTKKDEKLSQATIDELETKLAELTVA